MTEGLMVQFSIKDLQNMLQMLNEVCDEISYEDDIAPCIVTAVHSKIFAVISTIEEKMI